MRPTAAASLSSADAGSSHAAGDRDERLAAVLDGLVQAQRAGQSPNVARAIADHPDLADDLRALWATVLVAECVASGPDEPDATLALGVAASGSVPHSWGDFELLEELGRGGMGVVYKAHQRSLDRVVALKMVSTGPAASKTELARFRAEAQAVARLDHPSIVPLYEAGEHEGRPYFTMKFVEGTTLARRLAAGPLPPREAAALLAPICRAVHFAHQQGVLHRDLKPSNILIDAAGRGHVTDFGLAKLVGADADLTYSGALVGTPCHMAPEQAAGARGQVGPASDVYSLGTILYQMLTGRPPFQAASPVDTVLLVLEQEPVPPRLLNPLADRDLEMIALKCLQKPPELRYASAAALAADLDAFLADEPVAARSGLFSQVVARWFRETHHAMVLENWGVLWMWHSLVLLVISLLTNWLHVRGATSPWPYVALWTAGLGTWASIFWALRRRAGPVTFIERQIAHVWASSLAAIALTFVVEMLLGLPVLTLSPLLAISSGMVFLVKAGMLSGKFYVQALALFATAVVMAWLQRHEIRWGITLFGVVAAASFFLPGWKYHRQRVRAGQTVL